jgi:radical SAM superfamily enzyme YgiQ (UPF0313 family)
VEQIPAAADLCRRYGIETYFFMMFGYPGEEWVDIQKTIDLIRTTRPDMISSTIAYPLPGTDFYEDVKHRLLDAPDWDFTAENRLLFERKYSTRFYQWVQRWLSKTWEVTRWRHGDEEAPLTRRLRSLGALWRSRAMVELLRRTG